MAINYNRVIIAGNLTRDPEVRFLSNERAVCNFALAVNKKWKSKDGEQREDTTFVDCEAWGRTAELIGQYLTKGRAALVEGGLRMDQWEDQNGVRRNKLKVVAETVQFLDSQGQGRAQRPSQERRSSHPHSPPPPPQGDIEPLDADEPPF